MMNLLGALPGAVAQGIIWGIMAIGVYITFKILDMADLTVDGSFGTGGAVMVVSMSAIMPAINKMEMSEGLHAALAILIPILCVLLATLAGCAAGFVTGILHTKFGIPAILSGILTQLALYSINLRILSGKSNMALSVAKFKLLLNMRNIPKAIAVAALFAVIVIALLYWFFGTELGHSLRATGANQAMARANGINTNTNKIIGLIISNGIVALSGALLTQYQGFADINMGRGAIVIGLAAVIIGEVIFGKIFRNFALRLLAAIFGGIIYYLVLQIVLWAGLNANDLKLFSAVVVALFLGIPYWKNLISQKTKRVPKTGEGGDANA